MMVLKLPYTLVGDDLGQRHRYLNSLVNEAVAGGEVVFQDVEALNEKTAVDRLFKIDLAIKLKNLEYILRNLKHDDMLYVSKALKCKWLLERSDVINPNYLEDVLFPDMVMPAISKMKNWLYINLKEPSMCKVFYQYYKSKEFNFAVKFLHNCSDTFLMEEIPKILVHITPHSLKVLCEKKPKLVQIYYDSLTKDDELLKRYLLDEKVFYNSIKSLLKVDSELFLDITEKYYNLTSFCKLSPSATEYIVRYHKSRVMAKSELYIAHLLHLPTVAQRLSEEECKTIVIKLASADYLNSWFSYANVEPLVKRVSRDSRAAFKKKVFVEKNVGERVAEWPYPIPVSPVVTVPNSDATHVFYDQDYEPIEMHKRLEFKRMLKKRKGGGRSYIISEVKSELQKLFDEFRYKGFEGSLHELRGRISATSSADRRRDMLLVLVSKSGGRPESVRSLLQVALTLANEPVHERAAIVRSLVKRANAWRLPQDIWDSMLEYGHGLGLDGNIPEAECVEGLHGVVIRQLLSHHNCEPLILTAFLENFSTFVEYKLTATERSAIVAGLQCILKAAASRAEPDLAVKYLDYLLDVLEKYHIAFHSTISAVVAVVERDAEVAKPLLMRLYNARVGRRELLHQYLEFRCDDAALINLLRHDPYAFKTEWLLKLLTDEQIRATQFFLKIAIYFNESGGIADQVRRTLQDSIKDLADAKLARPMAILAGADLQSLWHEQDLVGSERHQLAAALRANMHRARPAPDALTLGWRQAGMKAVAWRAMRCRPSQVTTLVGTCFVARTR